MQPQHPARDDIRLENVLAALGNPLRLAVVQVIAHAGEHHCNAILPQVSKSTMTHHYRVLRDSGVARQSHVGREYRLSLRREDLDARFPGLLDAILEPLSNDPLTVESIAQYRQIVPGD